MEEIGALSWRVGLYLPWFSSKRCCCYCCCCRCCWAFEKIAVEQPDMRCNSEQMFCFEENEDKPFKTRRNKNVGQKGIVGRRRKWNLIWSSEEEHYCAALGLISPRQRRWIVRTNEAIWNLSFLIIPIPDWNRTLGSNGGREKRWQCPQGTRE